jgi:hypothetical protein
MKKLLTLSAAALLFAGAAFGQKAAAFEGQIDFWSFNGVDTSYYTYYVKGNHIKMVNTDPKSNNEEGIYLIDLTTKKTTALSPIRHVYFDQPSPAAVKPAGTPKVTKTANTKTIQGYKCTEYIVEDAEEGVKIHYWMAAGHFNFLMDLLNILNRKDKFSEYLLAIPGASGMFPMLAEQTDMSGASKGSMQATKVSSGSVVDGTFSIPAGYKEFKK